MLASEENSGKIMTRFEAYFPRYFDKRKPRKKSGKILSGSSASTNRSQNTSLGTASAVTSATATGLVALVAGRPIDEKVETLDTRKIEASFSAPQLLFLSEDQEPLIASEEEETFPRHCETPLIEILLTACPSAEGGSSPVPSPQSDCAKPDFKQSNEPESEDLLIDFSDSPPNVKTMTTPEPKVDCVHATNRPLFTLPNNLDPDSALFDEFDYYCHLAHSPVRSPDSSPPNNLDANRSQSLFSTSPDQTIPINSPGLHPSDSRFPSSRDSSPPNAKNSFRSRSVKESRSSHKRSFLGDDPGFRQRTSSRSLKVQPTRRRDTTGRPPSHSPDPTASRMLHQTGPTTQIYRVRSFKRTPKGVVSQGDSLRARSTGSLNTSQPQLSTVQCLDQQLPKDLLQLPLPEEAARPSSAPIPLDDPSESSPVTPDVASFCVQVLGGPGVGKSTLCRQFMTSEFLGGRTEQVSEEREERYVTVLLENQEWHLTFLDSVDEGDKDLMNVEVVDSLDAYMIVYAVDDHFSFEYAKQLLAELYTVVKRSVALFLVANKSDLVRSREVNSDHGRQLASVYGCKFLEISTALNHLVDELLVGIVIQIRNQIKRVEKDKQKQEKRRHGCSLRIRSPSAIFTRFIRKHFPSRSCEDLTTDVG